MPNSTLNPRFHQIVSHSLMYLGRLTRSHLNVLRHVNTAYHPYKQHSREGSPSKIERSARRRRTYHSG